MACKNRPPACEKFTGAVAKKQASLSDGGKNINWSGRRDLNSGPPAPKAGALPGCATPRHCETSILPYFFEFASTAKHADVPDRARILVSAESWHFFLSLPT